MNADGKPLTAEEIARLRALAEQATPGPYERPDAKRLGAGVVLGGEIQHYVNGSSRPQLALMTGERSAENAAFLAACDPQTVLRLLVAAESAAAQAAEIAALRQRAEAEVRRLRRTPESDRPPPADGETVLGRWADPLGLEEELVVYSGGQWLSVRGEEWEAPTSYRPAGEEPT